MKSFNVIVDSGLRTNLAALQDALSKAGVRDLKKEFSHRNPDFGRAKAMGLSTWKIPREIKTWRVDGDEIRFPRGGAERLREAARLSRARVRFIDRRLSHPELEFPEHRFPGGGALRWYQSEAIEAALVRQQGIIRAPTGSGKTSTGLALIARLQQPTLVVVSKRGLMDQWVRRIESELDIPPKEVGRLGGGKKKIGKRITVGLQQTLWSKKFDREKAMAHFGLVVVDEVQGVGSRTFLDVVDSVPAKYRIGLSADERRKDKKEFVIYDQFGEVVHECYRDDLEAEGSIVPVVARIIETDFDGYWYGDSGPHERDFGQLLAEIAVDDARDDLVVAAVKSALDDGQRPVLVFTRRREHALKLADQRFFANGIKSGLLLGGPEMAGRFDEDLQRLSTGHLDSCVGTIEAVGVGTDVPALRAGVMAMPLGNNPQLFNQIRGRICRPDEGKEVGYLYYLLDRSAFPEGASRLFKWCGGRVEVVSNGEWVEATRDGRPRSV